MKTLLKSTAFIFLALLVLSCGSNKKTVLFNGENLDNWSIYTGNPDVNPEDVFWVEDGILHTSGDPFGYLRTKESYSNYKLHVEWSWPGEPTNSGVLIHVQGEDRIFPHCIEAQLMHEKAGDIVLMGAGAGVTVKDSATWSPPTNVFTCPFPNSRNPVKILPESGTVMTSPQWTEIWSYL